MLLSAQGQWVSSVELSRVSLQYCARITELRADGWRIENDVDIHRGGQKHGRFRIQQFVGVEDGRLVTTPARATPLLVATRKPVHKQDEPPPQAVFDFGPREQRHRDEG